MDPTRNGNTRARRTIAVLIDYIDHLSRGYEYELREAFEAACKRLDYDLLIIAGRPLEDPDAWARAHNGIYELVSARVIQGLILVAPGLSEYVGLSGVERFAAQFPELRQVCLGVRLPGFPSIVVDNRSGMHALVEHLLQDHGCHRVAFVGGPPANPDAKLRFDIFQEEMARGGIEIDPRLVRHTEFNFRSGRRAIEDILRQGLSFDAVIAANDALGLGITEGLRGRNLRVPLNVRVTGFDDLLMSRLGDPPLSTVRQPLRRMAGLAVELLAAQFADIEVPPCTVLESEFIPRESCGCGSHGLRLASLPPRQNSNESADFVRRNRQRLLRVLRAASSDPDDPGYHVASGLIAALETELSGERLAFLCAIEHELSTSEHDEAFEDMQRRITLLREELRPVADPDLEELWHEARSQISLLATRSHVRRRVQLEDTYDRLLRTGERFSTNLELSSLSEALREELPVAQVRNAFVALYGPGDCRTLDPLFCLVDGESRPMLPEAYPAAEIFPPQTFSTRRRSTWVLLPLTFEAERLGVVGFEYTTSVVAYSMFRDRISAALKTADMHQEIVIQTAAHERNRQERLATAERIKSLSLLAGGVAHDLNNALGPLAALPDVLVHEIDRLAEWDSPAKREIVADLALIKSAAQRAAQTIKDLLTLGRQHQVKKETLDLNRIAAACATGTMDRRGCIELILELGSEPLWVNASDSHVSRAITNLLRNAAEAIPERGQIILRTWGEYLGSVFSGYELVEPGEYAVLSVRDSGQGIAPEMLKRIFEPFFSSKKLRDGSGSGLGLAIVHGVVKEHGGYINVMSQPGSGTEFTLYFPKALSPPKALVEPAILPGQGRGKLLVLDDDPMQLRTAKRILSHAGYDVVTADSGQRALALLKENGAEEVEQDGAAPVSPFDLVLLDMNLNEAEDGLEIFERMRSTYPNQRGILVSGHAPLERGELAQHRGLTWLSKPYTSDALLLAVQTVLLQVSPSHRPLWHPSDIEQRHLSFGPPESLGPRSHRAEFTGTPANLKPG